MLQIFQRPSGPLPTYIHGLLTWLCPQPLPLLVHLFEHVAIIHGSMRRLERHDRVLGAKDAINVSIALVELCEYFAVGGQDTARKGKGHKARKFFCKRLSIVIFCFPANCRFIGNAIGSLPQQRNSIKVMQSPCVLGKDSIGFRWKSIIRMRALVTHVIVEQGDCITLILLRSNSD